MRWSLSNRSNCWGVNIFFHQKSKSSCCALPVLPNLVELFRLTSVRRLSLFLLLVTVFFSPAWAGVPASLPQIARLDSRDAMFRQYMQDVEASRRVLFASRRALSGDEAVRGLASSLTIFSYVTQPGDTIFSIAARTNIPQATLASLNRLSSHEDVVPGIVLLLPSIPGIFVSETPANSLEQLISAARAEADNRPSVVLSIPRFGQTERFLFIPGDDFTQTERIFFLNRGFQFPLREFRVTSLYGPRINPVTGQHSMHRGIDLAAPMGTEVFAVRSGTVIYQGYDRILGYHIVISHDNNWASLYGHLSVINTVLNQDVQSGTVIGRVGSTGQSTGPHLHFELWHHGQTRDPARVLRIFRRTQ